jgi:serine kinase of HPr protein (carbohydrate metabolism regulator)
MALIHATCVALAAKGVLIRGASGAGKSDLALRLIDAGAELVGDDYCQLSVADGQLVATAGPNIAGKIEVRGYGIIQLPFLTFAPVCLVVDLLPEGEIERMPQTPSCTLEGISVPRLTVDARSASALAKVRLVLNSLS